MKRHRLEGKFIEELGRFPNVSVACERVGLSRQAVYRWRREDPEFGRAFDEALSFGRDGLGDLAESKLVSNVNRGDQRAVEFLLSRIHPLYRKDRKGLEDEAKKEEPIEFNIILNGAKDGASKAPLRNEEDARTDAS